MFSECMDLKYSLVSMDVNTSSLDIIDNYKVGIADVFITSDGRYLVREPHVSEQANDLYDIILKKIDQGVGFDDTTSPEEMAEKFEQSFWDTATRLERFEDAKRMFPDISYYIRRERIGYGILDVPMNDENIEDIMCSAYGRNIRINHKEYSGRFHTLESNIMFPDQTEMERFIQRIYGRTGTEPTESRPISVTYMSDGSRISSTFGRQVTNPGPIIAIRKFPKKPLTITHMMNSGMLTPLMAAYIWTLLEAKAVGLVIGITGAGKTTLLSAFVSMMNPRWRILTIEDTLELQIPHEDWVRYKTRKSYGMLSDKYDITMRHLIDSSLTQKPDYEIVGEIRLDDMDMMFQSVGTGHGGLTSFHASTPQGAITRMRGNDISDGEIALLWFSVHSALVKIGGKKTRRVTDISEIVSNEDGSIRIDNIFRYDIFHDRFDQLKGLRDSERYMTAATICGIDDIDADIKKRVGLLERCIKEDATEIGKVFEILGSYYD